MEKKKEFGDFQTPAVLAEKMIQILKAKNIFPSVVVEPTCGKGSILLEADKILCPKKSLGIEIQKEYVDSLLAVADEKITVLHADIFSSMEAIKTFIGNKENILFVGNPPWITNSELSANNSGNLPKKSNRDNTRGIEAITGKSNFDISEYIIRELTDEFADKKSVYAFLCKTSVAKKIMTRIWKQKRQYKSAEVFPIDSKKYFDAAVDACFFILDFSEKNAAAEMTVYDSIDSGIPKCKSGWVSGVYLEDISKRDCLKLYGKSAFVWRNGIKHDCAKVMEFSVTDDGQLLNGYHENVQIEEDLVFPYLKSSDIANGQTTPKKQILITQQRIGEQTSFIESKYPATWKYLLNHSADFEKRKSVIYKNKSRFAIFSVGEYSFKPYKIAVSGLYKNLNFQLIEPYNGKPVLLDDTCNFISFDTKKEAEFVLELLNSPLVAEYLNARISWDSKRPVKTEILNSIDLFKVAEKLNQKEKYISLFLTSGQLQFLFA